MRVELIQALVVRNAEKLQVSLRGLLNDGPELVRLEAARGLAAVGTAEDAPALIAYFKSARAADEAAVAERSLGAVCARHPQPCTPLILQAMADSQGEQRIGLLRMLSLMGGTEGGAVRQELSTSDLTLKDAALRTLAAWPDSEALADLLGIAKSEAALTHRVVAFQGYVRLLRTTPQPKGKIPALAAAMEAAPRIEDKKLVLAALAESPGRIPETGRGLPERLRLGRRGSDRRGRHRQRQGPEQGGLSRCRGGADQKCSK